MAEFVGGKEKTVDVDDLIIFENNTDSNYEVSTGVVFHKSGVYEVSIVGNRTIVSKVSERKTGKWNWIGFNIECSECGAMPNFDSTEPLYNFCPNCGSYNGGEEDEPMQLL